MAGRNIHLKDGEIVEVRRYRIEGESVRLEGLDGQLRVIAREAVDAAATFAGNAGWELAGASDGAGLARLELVAVRESAAGDYLVVEGSVRNAGACALKDVVARVRGLDAEGRTLTAEEALVQSGTLEGEAAAPFRVILRSGGMLRRTVLEFRTLAGEALALGGAAGG